MNLQELLCQEFCGTLTVREVKDGFAIGTGYQDKDGDSIGFYVIGPDEFGKFRIEDDGLSISMIEANGVDLSSKTRSEAFHTLLNEYNVLFDEENGELSTDYLPEDEIGSASMRFLGFMLRVQDLLLLTQEKIASTFKEDAIKMLDEKIGGRAKLIEAVYVHDSLKENVADLVISAEGRNPVALYFGTSESKVLEALLLQSYSENKGIDCSVVALLESSTGIKRNLQERAQNHLDATLIFRGHESDAIDRVVKEAIGNQPAVH